MKKTSKKKEGENAQTVGMTGFLNVPKFDNTTPFNRLLFLGVL
ncbi:hypothetical protein S3E15_03913 [Bacillus mycoides]|uniref:Uncharacterized protein n=1 Tax=Bacillus mycoides TaxID=1405 RepID=A0AAP8BCC4_BACMY|nr:hypothetical protein S3E15_03913 [Bacillus mycoides]